MIREALEADLQELLHLYLFLHEDRAPEITERVRRVWEQMVRDPNHHVIVAEEEGRLVASCVCVIIPNLTRGIRPYALVENVVTHAGYRKKGLATGCLNYARTLAKENHCYKIMLMTGSREESTLRFYKNAGFDDGEKKAFIKRLES